MKAFTLWYDDTMPELPGAEAALVANAIKRACIEFCERSQFHRQTLTAINVVSGTASYALTAPSAAYRICGVVEVQYDLTTDQKELFPKTRDDLDAKLGLGWESLSGDVIYYLQDTINTVRLVRKPDEAITAGLVVRVAMAPDQAATEASDEIYNEFYDAIAAGAKYRLMLMPSKPWSNSQMAGFYRDRFESEIGAAQVRAARGYGRAPMRTRPA